MKTILVTGGAGFIGSHFVDTLLEETQSNVVVFDKLTYAGKFSNMDSFLKNDRVTFVQGDIAVAQDVEKLFSEYEFLIIFNFAAESHVDNSINSPNVFVETNVNGTHNLLINAKIQWTKEIDWENKYRFIQISTDEVYGMLGEEGSFNEQTCLNPSSPYSASKAAADLLCISYFKTYKFPIIITRSSNNFGPRQDREKLIPKTIFNALNNLKIPIYGDGLNVRDWIFVKDNCRAIYLLSSKGDLGNVYNVGGNNEQNNLQIVNTILEKTESLGKDLIEFVPDRVGHDFRYSVDDTKAKKVIGSYVISTFDHFIELTIDFYKKNII